MRIVRLELWLSVSRVDNPIDLARLQPTASLRKLGDSPALGTTLPTQKTHSTTSSAKRCRFMAARTGFCLELTSIALRSS